MLTFLRKRARWLLPGVAVGCAGAAAIVYATASGFGVTKDSLAYIEMARSLADGRGMYVTVGDFGPATWGPLFPALLSVPILAGLGPEAGGVVVNALLLVVSSVAGAWIALTLAPGVRLAPWAGALAVVSFSPMWDFNVTVLSEPLFTALMLGFIALAIRFRQDPRRRDTYVGLIVVATAAALARYLGVAVAAAGASVVALGTPGRLRDKVARALPVAAIPVLAVAAWVVPARAGEDAVSPGAVAFDPAMPVYEDLRQTVVGIGAWVAPWTQRYGRVLGAALVAIVVVWLFARVRGRSDALSRSTVLDVSILAAWYTATLFAVRGIGGPPIIPRFFAPVGSVVILIVVALFVRAVARSAAGRGAVISLALAALFASHAAALSADVEAWHREGVWINRVDYRASPMLDVVGGPADGLAYSNYVEVLWYLRPDVEARLLPPSERLERGSFVPADFDDAFAATIRSLEAVGGAIVYFDGFVSTTLRWPSVEELRASLPEGWTERAHAVGWTFEPPGSS